ncbi:TonB family protein [uncultured Parasphingorhabdus sp.]|uniref:energy transducer TonB n=1 Tax=uncultured Parasphingorhabdus sp. TaxID=2709694 RepID=UPI0030D96467|tara:strand:+ start:125835 stop:126497 length:663 start_codon:yes stop_codon:yes gene_type:complete
MSYVSVYENKTPRSKGVAMAVGVHALIIAGAMAMPEIVAPEKFKGTIIAFPVKVQTPPEPVIEDKKPEIKIASPTRQTLPERSINIDVPDPFVPVNNYGNVEIKAGSGGFGDAIRIDPIKIAPDPVIVGASLNRRYAGDFQPAYPVGQLRREIEGTVSVRVLVGTDGRVKDIQLIESPHEDFWTATRKQALGKWRFTAATKDGKPVESWMTLKVRFEING